MRKYDKYSLYKSLEESISRIITNVLNEEDEYSESDNDIDFGNISEIHRAIINNVDCLFSENDYQILPTLRKYIRLMRRSHEKKMKYKMRLVIHRSDDFLDIFPYNTYESCVFTVIFVEFCKLVGYSMLNPFLIELDKPLEKMLNKMNEAEKFHILRIVNRIYKNDDTFAENSGAEIIEKLDDAFNSKHF